MNEFDDIKIRHIDYYVCEVSINNHTRLIGKMNGKDRFSKDFIDVVKELSNFKLYTF